MTSREPPHRNRREVQGTRDNPSAILNIEKVLSPQGANETVSVGRRKHDGNSIVSGTEESSLHPRSDEIRRLRGQRSSVRIGADHLAAGSRRELLVDAERRADC